MLSVPWNILAANVRRCGHLPCGHLTGFEQDRAATIQRRGLTLFDATKGDKVLRRPRGMNTPQPDLPHYFIRFSNVVVWRSRYPNQSCYLWMQIRFPQHQHIAKQYFVKEHRLQVATASSVCYTDAMVSKTPKEVARPCHGRRKNF